MNSNIRSFMLLSAGFFLFLGTGTYAVKTVESINEGTKLAYKLNAENDRQVKAKIAIPGEEVYSGSMIVNLIRTEERDMDIEVGGVLYSKLDNYTSFNPTPINLNQRYKATYSRDESGYILKVSFSSM
ncbi:hypothetical protein ASD24_24840 [Paenibacillus sp. Root52]|uniref:hypothetical protein n=1 Tax=Paenibacillus sp. Root52 TaxID=1736552 RepID=UPI0006FC9BE7|nr:hypothetical protein [Paenibacillus sp. Root52]KQY91026.1 hypothetical protein ASD24_24840 [Paenibacillus sp. Root52]